MSDVPAWALLGGKDSPRSMEIRDRRVPEGADAPSGAYCCGAQLDNEPASTVTRSRIPRD